MWHTIRAIRISSSLHLLLLLVLMLLSGLDGGHRLTSGFGVGDERTTTNGQNHIILQRHRQHREQRVINVLNNSHAIQMQLKRKLCAKPCRILLKYFVKMCRETQ
jgi:hypothetical protein